MARHFRLGKARLYIVVTDDFGTQLIDEFLQPYLTIDAFGLSVDELQDYSDGRKWVILKTSESQLPVLLLDLENNGIPHRLLWAGTNHSRLSVVDSLSQQNASSIATMSDSFATMSALVASMESDFVSIQDNTNSLESRVLSLENNTDSYDSRSIDMPVEFQIDGGVPVVMNNGSVLPVDNSLIVNHTMVVDVGEAQHDIGTLIRSVHEPTSGCLVSFLSGGGAALETIHLFVPNPMASSGFDHHSYNIGDHPQTYGMFDVHGEAISPAVWSDPDGDKLYVATPFHVDQSTAKMVLLWFNLSDGKESGIQLSYVGTAPSVGAIPSGGVFRTVDPITGGSIFNLLGVSTIGSPVLYRFDAGLESYSSHVLPERSGAIHFYPSSNTNFLVYLAADANGDSELTFISSADPTRMASVSIPGVVQASVIGIEDSYAVVAAVFDNGDVQIRMYQAHEDKGVGMEIRALSSTLFSDLDPVIYLGTLAGDEIIKAAWSGHRRCLLLSVLGNDGRNRMRMLCLRHDYSFGLTRMDDLPYDLGSQIQDIDCIDTGDWMIYTRTTTSSLNSVKLNRMSDTLPGSHKYVGVTTSSSSEGVVNVALPGSVLDNMSGLVPGKDVFVGTDGAMSQVRSSDTMRIGLAVSDTQVFLSDEVERHESYSI